MASSRRAGERGVVVYEMALGAAKLGNQPRSMLCEHAAQQEGLRWRLCHVGNVREGHGPAVRELWEPTGVHWKMGGRRWKKTGGQSGPDKTRQGSLKKGCI